MATKLTIQINGGKQFHQLFELEAAAEDYKRLICKHGFKDTETKERFFPDQIEFIDIKEYDAKTKREESQADQGIAGTGEDTSGGGEEI